MNRPGEVEVANLRHVKGGWRARAPRHECNTEIRLQKLHQIAFRGNLVEMHCRLLAPQAVIEALRMFAITAAQELRLRKIGELDGVAGGKLVFRIENKIERLLEQGPCVEPVPIVIQSRGNGELDFAFLQRIGNFLAAPSNERKF
jgi:hypothetical protein